MNRDYALTLWRADLVRFGLEDRQLQTGKAVIAHHAGWLRRYHGLEHLAFLFQEIEAHADRIKDLPRLTYAAWFHDDGRFLHAKKGVSRFDVFQTLSSDGGLTWSQPVAIAHRPDVHLCEPGVVRSPDGKTIALLMRENSRRRNSFVIFSRDEGSSWSTPKELPAALTGDRHTAIYTPDGRLFISFRDTTRESATKGDWVGWVGTWQDIVDGKEGQYRVRLMDNHVRGDCAYPAVLQQKDGTIIAITYGHWTRDESPWIACRRFTISELDSRFAALGK